MPILPIRNSEALAWLQTRTDGWIENAAAIGLTPAQATAVQGSTNAAQTRVTATEAARAASLAATVAQNGAYSEMRDDAQTAIDIIRAFANNSPDPAAVYALAQVPPPSVPLPKPPENPYGTRFDLLPTGQLEVKWSGNSNGGTTIYIVMRSVQTDPQLPAGPMEILGFVGAKTYIDANIPACTIAATYIIKAAKGPHTTTGSTPATARFVPNNADTEPLVIAA